MLRRPLTVHPLQTESVTYLSQRAESLAALFYLLTLFCFIRGVETHGIKTFWAGASILSCFVGMGCKETMVTAPVLVFLYDRTFVAGGFRKAWTARRTFYLGLSATWTGLAYLLATMGATRGGSAGFSHGVEWWPYVCSQCEAVVHYLRLGLWPSPLVFDYGQGLTASLRAIWPQALGLAALLGGTVYSLCLL
ncbi:MAG TPA: hypothetical protein DEQ47_03290, partial [Solibacterales bacterium]|nr:hypothetical protein [Bryobacterales bacterium]